MPTVTVVERLPYSVNCGFRPEQVKGLRLAPRCVEVDVLDDGPLRPGHRYNVTFHTMRIPFCGNATQVPGGWTGPQADKPEGAAQA